ncbi:hypothetical protein LSPCS325_00410 [Lysinibacillus sp. CTST325]
MAILSVALTSIRLSGGSFRRFGFSILRLGPSFRRFDFFPSLRGFFPSLRWFFPSPLSGP